MRRPEADSGSIDESEVTDESPDRFPLDRLPFDEAGNGDRTRPECRTVRIAIEQFLE